MWVLAKINNKSPVRGKSGLKISAATVTTDNNGATPEKNTRKNLEMYLILSKVVIGSWNCGYD